MTKKRVNSKEVPEIAFPIGGNPGGNKYLIHPARGTQILFPFSLFTQNQKAAKQ